MSEAYLYLGIAFLGKGHEAAAKAKFKEAVKLIKDLTLSPEKFAPKVINLVEAAKAEAAQATTTPTTAVPAAKKGGGSGKLLVIGGVVIAGGAAAAIAGGGNKSSNGSSNSPSAACTSITVNRTGILVQPNDSGVEVITTPAQTGNWTAQIDWNGTAPLPNLSLFINHNGTSDGFATGTLTASTPTSARRTAQWTGTAGTQYRVAVFLDGNATTSVNYSMTVTGPCPQ